MKKTVLLAASVGIFAMGCAGDTPTSPTPLGTATTSISPTGSTPLGTATTSTHLGDFAGVQRTSISGTIVLVSLEPPERRMVTPSGMVHVWGLPEHTLFTGDVAGPVTFQASSTSNGDRTHRVFRGPFEGEVTFQGRTGRMTGQWTTNCKWDDALGNVSCGGTMNARGEGGLDGVQFHFLWGPGWWPFSYSGTAFSQK